MKIDIVYTWVDGADPKWNKKRNAIAEKLGNKVSNNANSEARFKQNDELKYSLRSVFQFAPWVNNIFIVTDNQSPSWLDVSHPKITIIDHASIFKDKAPLPSFSSRGIESNLHRIKNLSGHFISFNDDVFLGRLTKPTHFFTPIGKPYKFTTSILPQKRKWHFDRSKLKSQQNNEHKHAIINSRKLISSSLKIDIHHDFRHTVKPMFKSVIFELEKKYSTAFLQTSKHLFRESSAIVPSHLFGFYAIAKNIGKVKYLKLIHKKARWSDILYKSIINFSYAYVNLSTANVQAVLNKIKKVQPSTFYINQYSDISTKTIEQMKLFLESYFPEKAEYEIE